MHVLDSTQLMYWNEVRYHERVSGDQDKLKSFEDVKVFPVRKQLNGHSYTVPEKAIILKSLVKQDYEPEHLLLQLKGCLVINALETEEKTSGIQNGVALFHLVGQPKVNQSARELLPFMSSLASKGAFLCIIKDASKAFLWLGQYFISLYGTHVKINEASTVISKELLKRVVRSYCKDRGLGVPEELPEVRVQLEGKENKEIISVLGESAFIKNELKYRKKVLDPRDCLYYNSAHGFNFTFENNYVSHTLMHKDNEVTIMDTNKEIFLLPGEKLSKEDRRQKCKNAIKSFFAGKKHKSLVQKAAISIFSIKSKIYAVMKYLVL